MHRYGALPPGRDTAQNNDHKKERYSNQYQNFFTLCHAITRFLYKRQQIIRVKTVKGFILQMNLHHMIMQSKIYTKINNHNQGAARCRNLKLKYF